MQTSSNPSHAEAFGVKEAKRLSAQARKLAAQKRVTGPMYAAFLKEQAEEMRKAVGDAYIACQPTAYRTPAHQHDFTSLPEFPHGLEPLETNDRIRKNALLSPERRVQRLFATLERESESG